MMSLGFIANLKLMRKGLIKNCRPMANPGALICFGNHMHKKGH